MDKIELHVAQHAGAALGRAWHAIFGVAGGTIGRGGQNKLVLPDVDAGVARVHAMVRLDSEQAYIANLCERRVVWVDDMEVRSGQEVVLPLGAQVRIGPYLLKATKFGAARPSETGADPEPMIRSAGGPAPMAPLTSAPIRAVSGPSKLAATPNPWADIEPQVRDPYALLSSLDAGARPGVSQAAGAARVDRAMLIPPDFDPFARDVRRDAQAKDPWAGGLQAKSLAEVANLKSDGLLQSLPLSGRFESALDNPAHPGLPKHLEPSTELDPLVLFGERHDDLALDAAPSSLAARGTDLAQLFSLPKEAGATSATRAPGGDAAPAAAAVQQVAQSLGLQRTQGLDLSMFGAGPSAASGLDLVSPVSGPLPVGAAHEAHQALETHAGRPSAPRSVRELSETATWPIAVPPAAATADEAPRPVEAPARTGVDELAQAFLEGAGLSPARVDLTLTPEFMRSFGEAFRVAVQGTIDLLAARSEIKREFRAGVTIMSSGANNPLKFLPNADGVIMQLAGQGFPGFMKTVPAMQDAYRDLRVHQLGLMAGIRAAYTAALTRFDPTELEKRPQPQAGLFSSFSSLGRKAAWWDDYKRGYNNIRQHAEDDLTAFSGQTFVDAYEAAADAAKEVL